MSSELTVLLIGNMTIGRRYSWAILLYNPMRMICTASRNMENKECPIDRDAETRICKGFGYINFESEDGVEGRLATNHQTQLRSMVEKSGFLLQYAGRRRRRKAVIQIIKKFRKDKKPRTNTASFEGKNGAEKRKVKALLSKRSVQGENKNHSFQV